MIKYTPIDSLTVCQQHLYYKVPLIRPLSRKIAHVMEAQAAIFLIYTTHTKNNITVCGRGTYISADYLFHLDDYKASMGVGLFVLQADFPAIPQSTTTAALSSLKQ